jgi:hypothetical protein
MAEESYHPLFPIEHEDLVLTCPAEQKLVGEVSKNRARQGDSAG